MTKNQYKGITSLIFYAKFLIIASVTTGVAAWVALGFALISAIIAFGYEQKVYEEFERDETR